MSGTIDITHNLNQTNTISDKEFYSIVKETSNIIYDLLEEHCGPYASDTMIVINNPSSFKDSHYTVFTKDGINIVNAIEFTAPIQKHIQMLFEYVGSRVEAISHDGTTTSMMLLSALLSAYMNKAIQSIKDNTLNRKQIQKEFLKDFTDIFDNFKENIVTIDDIVKDFNVTRQEALKFVAYNQSMVSSKGDVELTEAIVEFTSTLPVEIFGLYSISQSHFETEKRFTVTTDEYDFNLNCISAVSGALNHNMRMEYFSDHCDLILCEDEIMRGHPGFNLLINYIEQNRPEAFPLIVNEVANIEHPGMLTGSLDSVTGQPTIIPNNSYVVFRDQTNFQTLGTWFYTSADVPLTRPEKVKDIVIITKGIDGQLIEKLATINRMTINKVAVFQMSTPNSLGAVCTELEAILYMAGRYSIMDHIADQSRPFVIETASVHWKNNNITISNLYEKDGSMYHPFYTNKEAFLPYTTMVRTLKSHLDDFDSGRTKIEKSNDRHRRDLYANIYTRMICATVKHIKITGNYLDVLADKDILTDSLGATMSSIRDGFVFDGMFKFAYLSKDKNAIISNAFLKVLGSVHRTNPSNINDTFKDVEENLIKYNFLPVDKKLQEVCLVEKSNSKTKELVSYSSLSDEKNDVILIQPADTYRELNKRILDIIPKLINTSRAIIPGTVHQDVGVRV